jgi:hypothetical protein
LVHFTRIGLPYLFTCDKCLVWSGLDREPATPSKFITRGPHSQKKNLLETTTAIVCDSPPYCCPSSPRSVDELRTKGRGLPFCSTGRLVRRPPRAQTRKKPTRYFAWSGSNNPPDQSLDSILVARRYTVRVSLRLCTTNDSPHATPTLSWLKGTYWHRLTAAHPSKSAVDTPDNELPASGAH